MNVPGQNERDGYFNCGIRGLSPIPVLLPNGTTTNSNVSVA